MFLNKKRLIHKKTWILTILIGILVISWIVSAKNETNDYYGELKRFTEVVGTIQEEYVDEVNMQEIITGAIRGLVSSLDSHSTYLTPKEFKDFHTDIKGEFSGLGIQIGMKEGVLTVIAPIEDTPAFKAGIESGDKILKINGSSTKNMGIDIAVSKMRGPKGKPATITIFRENWKDTKDFTIIRDVIKVKSVKSKLLPDSIGYIKLTQFQEKTATELAAALENLDKSNMKALILDLRNNPGGSLEVAVDVAGQFLPVNKLIVYIKNREGKKNEFFSSSKKEELKSYSDLPMVVLVNQGSASASEIVAGALRDWNRAIIVGVQTFGKGSVQNLIPLNDGYGLKLTIAKYYTPNNISIQNVGIVPDIVVKLESKTSKEITVIREKDLDRHLKNEQTKEVDDKKTKDEKTETAVYEVEEKDDTQLQRAVDIIKTWKILQKMPKTPA